MKPSSKYKPQRKPIYDSSLQDQTMLFWRLQQQWNHREVPGYTWAVGEALRLLGAMSANIELPYALRDAAEALSNAIIVNAKAKPSDKANTKTFKILTLKR